MKRLQNKVAVIYGAGAVGSAMTKAFTSEGAMVFLKSRAQVDATDEQAVENHMEELIKKIGRIDISFNAIGVPQKGIQGIGLTDLSVDSFMHPITTYLQSHFITARAAARRMVKQGNGVILVHIPNASWISPPFVGGMVPAWAGMEAFVRSLSVECGSSGVRAVALMTTGIPETPLIDEVWQIHGKKHGITQEQFHKGMEEKTHRSKLTTLAELTNTAIFAASDEGSAITGTIINLTAGMIV